MYLALSICVLFVYLIQSVNGAQFLNTTSLSLLFGSTTGGGTGAIVIVPFPYISLKSNKFDLHMKVLNLLWLLVLYVAHASLFIVAQLFVLNLVGWFGVLSNKFIIFWYSIIILF